MKTLKPWLYRGATLAIFGGFLMLIQPLSFAVFTHGFPVLLAGVIAFMILDHLPA
ncbi:MAG: hypothetical protein U1F68_03640 [Gammaproteobacteria bacterium]